MRTSTDTPTLEPKTAASPTVETPRGAIEDLRRAIDARDYDRLKSRLDLTEFINRGYDDAIDQLAINCDRFHRKYPNDLLFQFGATALRAYNTLFRSLHLKLLFEVIEACFRPEPPSPKKFSDDPIGYCAYHFDQLIRSTAGEVVDESTDGDRSSVTVEFRAELIGVLRFRFGMERVEGRWRVIRIENAAELVEPLVDIAERVWPREWDRGIKL